MMTREEYLKRFEGKYDPTTRSAKALELALDIRKFEIELYWKRATYFWAFIAATFGGLGLVQKLDDPFRTDLSVWFSSLGIVFSFGWYCINRGSKHWQINWEKHVDVLEDVVLGPLYKTIAETATTEAKRRKFSPKSLATSEAPYSVSKVNQIVSLFVFSVWIVLLIWTAAPPSRWSLNWHNANLQYMLAVVLAVGACIAIGRCGKTDDRNDEKITFRERGLEVVNDAAVTQQNNLVQVGTTGGQPASREEYNG